MVTSTQLKPYKFFLFLVILIFAGGGAFAGGAETDTVQPNAHPTEKTTHLNNPEAWLNDCYSRLNDLYLFQIDLDFDTTRMAIDLKNHLAVVAMLQDEFTHSKEMLNIRTIYNMKMRVAGIVRDVSIYQSKVHKVNQMLVNKAQSVVSIRTELADFRTNADSSLFRVFKLPIEELSDRQKDGETMIMQELNRVTTLENRLIEIKLQISLFANEVNSALKSKEASLIKQELPPIWKATPSDYPHSFIEVVYASFIQTIESVKIYGESSLWRIILFRVLIFMLCLVPIRLFNNKLRKNELLADTELVFLEKFPKTASLIMGMALAPLIFVHPPHAFMEFILIGLTVTVTSLTMKHYPLIHKKLLIFLISAFLILYLINFFVTPTFVGRIIYALSIFLLIPMYRIYKALPSFKVEYEKMVRFLLIFMGLHLIVGWVLVILGLYTLGRSVILSAYSLLVISMILRIAIYTLLDYIEIMVWFANKNATNMRINIRFVQQKAKPLLLLVALSFIVVAYLFNMNVFDLIKSAVRDFMTTEIIVGDAQFTPWSITLFILSVYLAFTIATLIRYSFDYQNQPGSGKKNNLGSYLFLLRLVIICAGFIIGILASGIPMTNFTIFFGAMGVGIGLGLQNMVSNLISGLIIAFEHPFVIGDYLEIGEESGQVKEISLRATLISTSDGAEVLIPNNSLVSDNLKNWTVNNNQRYMEIIIETVHEVNPVLVLEILSKCLKSQENVHTQRSSVTLEKITESGMSFALKILLEDMTQISQVRTQLLSKVHQRFTEQNISFSKKGVTLEED